MSGENIRVLRYLDDVDLARQAAARLLDVLLECQADGRVAQLCLTGGRIAAEVYQSLADFMSGSELDPGRLELWWGDERFVPTDDPLRNAGPTLAALAGRIALDPARTHPMPAADGVVDADASAATYAKELGDTHFDICLLGVGPDGHVASIFPGHPSADQVTGSVIGVSESPKPPAERISLTLPRLSRSTRVWFLVSGADKAHAVAQSLAGDQSLPAARVHGEAETLWLVDRAAASLLPHFECSQ